MARRVRDANLESREARARLKPRPKPYWRAVDRGLHIGYRRLKGKPGTWTVRCYVTKRRTDSGKPQPYDVERLGTADDLADADGIAILDFWQAQSRAREHMVRRAHEAVDGTGTVAPALTVGIAVVEYLADRDARETRRRGRPVRSDAHRLSRYVTGREQRGNRKAIERSKLADVELSALDEGDLRKWRNGLPETLKGASKRRTINDLKAALNNAYMNHRKHLSPTLPATIKHGLKATNGHDDDAEPVARDNQILEDARVTRLLRAARQVDEEQSWDGDLYRLVVVLAATGARFSQVARLRVGDCQTDKPRRLLIPKSRKGRGKAGSITVPVAEDTIAALLPVVTGRASDAPLLERWRHRQTTGGKWERADRGPWQSSSEFDRAWNAVRERANMPGVIPYALRHSSIVRGLRANLPVRLVAALHDTSVVMIERHYARFITEGLEKLAAEALVALLPRQRGGRVVPLHRPKGHRKATPLRARR